MSKRVKREPVSLYLKSSTRALLEMAAEAYTEGNMSHIADKLLTRYSIELLKVKGVDWEEKLKEKGLYDRRKHSKFK